MNLTSLNVILLNCEQEVMAALHSFNSYHHIWKEDREDAMRKYDELNICMLLWLWRAEVFSLLCFYRFIQDSPTLSEFESQIIFYRNLEMQISAEPEYIVVGALALFTGNNIHRNASLTS